MIASHAKPSRVLLVEDDDLLRRTLARMLAFKGFEVTATPSRPPPDGVFDVGVFDVHLESDDGVRLAQSLLDASVVRAALFLTGSVDAGELSRAAAVGTVIDKSDYLVLLRTLGEFAATAASEAPTVAPPRRRGS